MLYIYIGVFELVGNVANTALYCSSDDILVTLDNPTLATHFCNITGTQINNYRLIVIIIGDNVAIG